MTATRKPILSVLAGDILARSARIKFTWKPGQFKRMCETVDLSDLGTLCALAKHGSDREFTKNLIETLRLMDYSQEAQVENPRLF